MKIIDVCGEHAPLRVTNYTHNGGKCSNCGSCCSNYLPLDNVEISRIRRYVQKHNIQPCNYNAPFANGIENLMRCPFRDDLQKKCTIYPVRPRICATYKCDKDQSTLLWERSDAHHRSNGSEVDMRGTFFDDPVGTRILLSLLAG